MLEIHYFECEICGKTFTNEADCRAHELTHSLDDFPHNELMMWNGKGERITVKNIMENADLMEEIWAVETSNSKAKEYLRDIFDEVGMECCPYDRHHYPNENGLIYYDEDPNDWVSFADKQAELNAIREKFDRGD